MKKSKFIKKAKRLLSGFVATAIAASMIPTLPAMAEETTEKYPYTLFAGSSEEGAITVNAGNFCVNGNIATNGTIVSSGNMNINGTRTESAEESMIFIFDKIDNQYFSASNVEEYAEDYTLDELNININVPTEVQGEATLTGNININDALKALGNVNLYGEVKNTNDSVIFSKYGDIIIDSQNVNLNGLVYAPFGSVNITAQNLNLNNVVIVSDSIVLTCPNVNANNSSSVSAFVGTNSDQLDIPSDEWQYMKDDNGNGIPDYFENNEEGPGEIPYIDPLEATYELSVNNQKILVGTDSTALTFFVETLAEPEEILLYDDECVIGQMYDDGNYSAHGDDMKGDGVYSLKYTITDIPDKTTTRHYYARINDSLNSNEIELSIVIPFSQDEIDNMDYVNDLIKDILDSDPLPEELLYVDAQDATNSFIPESLIDYFNSKINKLLAALQKMLDDGRIKNYSYDDTYKCIKYEYTNGIPIFITPDDILDLRISRDSDSMIIIDDPDAPTTKYQGYNMAIFNAFDPDRDDYYNDLVKRLRKHKLSVDYYDNVKVETVKNKLTNHDIVVLSGHGSYLTGNISTFNLHDHLATSTLDSTTYQDDLLNGRLIHHGNGFYSITAEFINFYFGTRALDNTYIFSESCEFFGNTTTGLNNDFADAYTSRSAEAVVGFENSVEMNYSREFMEFYCDKLLMGKTTQESFDAATSELGNDDSSYRSSGTVFGIPILRGDTNAALVKKVKNGDFERKTASGSSIPLFWTGEGDVRVIDKIGSLSPYGKSMAFISTGIGAKSAVNMSGTQGSYLSQTIYNDGLSKLEFKYKMISEEPMEFVGRAYDDAFEIQILDLDDNVLFNQVLESVNRSTWYEISGIDFEGGDSTVFATRWKSGSIDISAYKNQSIKIRFLVYDVGDSAYDSAVLIDNVVCN